MVVMRAWRERLTQSGRFVVIGAMASGISTAFPGQSAGTVAFSFFAGLLLTAWGVSLFNRPRLAVERHLADRCMAGQTIPMTIRVRNDSKKPQLDIGAYEFNLPKKLKLQEESNYLQRLEPRQSHEFEYALRTHKRGLYVLHGATGLSAFPFALTHAKRFSPQTHRLSVYPKFAPIRDLRIHTGERHQPGGVMLLSKVGESMEYVGNREYRLGDRVRDLHLRSWARVGRPIVRQYQQEYMTRVAMIVDTFTPYYKLPHFRTSGTGLQRLWKAQMLIGADIEMFEAQLSLAAAVADNLARRDYLIDFFVAGPTLHRFQSGRSLAHLENVLDVLACLERCRKDSLRKIMPSLMDEMTQMSCVVVLLLRWDETRRLLLDNLVQCGARVRAVLLSDNAQQIAAAEKAGVTHLMPSQVFDGVEEL